MGQQEKETQKTGVFTITMIKVVPGFCGRSYGYRYEIPCNIGAYYEDGDLHFLPDEEIVWQTEEGDDKPWEPVSSVTINSFSKMKHDDFMVYIEDDSGHLIMEYYTNQPYSGT